MGGSYYIRNKNGKLFYGPKLTTINNVAGENSNSTTEVVLSRLLIPAQSLVVGDRNIFTIDTRLRKNNTNGSLIGRIRIGTGGTTTDPLVATFSGSSTQTYLPITRDIKIDSGSAGNVYPSNQTNITIPSLGTASAYPITFNVSNVNFTVNQVQLSLSGYSHTWAGDVAMVLVSPDTTKYSLLTGRNGGSTDASNVNVNFRNDTATVWNGFSGGNFKNNSRVPGTIGSGFTFNPPCPVPPFSASTNSPEFIVFDGIPPSVANGTWSLYIQDFSSSDTGSLSSATLELYRKNVLNNNTTEVLNPNLTTSIDGAYSGQTLSDINIDWTKDVYISVTGQLISSLDQMNCMYIYVREYI